MERKFGFDSIETAVHIGDSALATLAAALVMDRPELDPSASPIEVVAAAYRGDSAASATIRRLLEELGLDYESRCDDGPLGHRSGMFWRTGRERVTLHFSIYHPHEHQPVL